MIQEIIFFKTDLDVVLGIMRKDAAIFYPTFISLSTIVKLLAFVWFSKILNLLFDARVWPKIAILFNFSRIWINLHWPVETTWVDFRLEWHIKTIFLVDLISKLADKPIVATGEAAAKHSASEAFKQRVHWTKKTNFHLVYSFLSDRRWNSKQIL